MPVGAIIGSAAVGAAGSAYAANRGTSAANRAAEAQSGAAQNQLQYAQELNAPYQFIGNQALNVLGSQFGLQPFGGSDSGGLPQGASYDTGRSMALSSSGQGQPDYSAFYEDPGYQFRLDEGTRQINNSLLARGMGLSGQQLKATQEYGQNLASQEYGNWYSRLAGLAGIGGAATQNLQTAGQNAYGQMGAAQAQRAVNQGNISGNLAQNMAGIAGGTMSNLNYAKQMGWI